MYRGVTRYGIEYIYIYIYIYTHTHIVVPFFFALLFKMLRAGIINMEDGKQGSEELPETKTSI